ncbi:hypothetical protein BGZ73_006358 [Actinomortierella ambigua]|nr:hypothetical protein BGZ73_006358 [Actinomortierella ambigua]
MSVPATTLSIGNFIGAGGYGSVFHARWGKRKVAIKKFSLTQDEAKQAKAIQDEIGLLERLRDRHIVQFYGTTYHEGLLVLVMDFAEGGSLTKVIEKGMLDWPNKIRIAQEIVCGLEYIHGEGIVHRDLKSANVLLTKHMEVKLCDFGLAMAKIKSSSKSTGDSLKGTFRWMAPELFSAKPQYSTKSDMYALAVVMWEMAANSTMPFRNQPDNFVVMSLIKAGEREELPFDTPADYRARVERCWDQDPARRPEARDMVVDEDEPEEVIDSSSSHGDSVSISMSFSVGFSDASTVVGSSSFQAAIKDDGKKNVEWGVSKSSLSQPPTSTTSKQGRPEMLQLLERAGNNDVEAMMELALAHEQGIFAKESKEEEFAWYKRAAKMGNAKAQFNVGRMFRFGYGTPQNKSEAATWYRKAADQGYAEAQVALALMYKDGEGVPKNPKEAILLYEKAAEQGNYAAKYTLKQMRGYV